MNLPENAFKRAILSGRQQVGLWCMLPGSFVTEALAGAGFDWLLLDTEHSPADPLTVLPQLQAAAAYDVSTVVRPASNDPVLIKRMLDSGAQSLLVPYVQTVAEAEAAVAAVRYPPDGIRGVAGLTRASRFGRVQGYAQKAAEEICLLVQVETVQSLDAIEAIAAVDGVDGIFIGPGDLSASLGHPGELFHPEVVAAVEGAISRVAAAGKPAGVLTYDIDFARRCMDLGSLFTAVGADLAILMRGVDRLAGEFKTR
ncbi:aldolase/citrate lyase family protein [Pelagibius marinus]|uniref:aldolase/citrate lyase family protein n=1 Tax=Pelagibius marinus TaxID=2762760 RepID=UPI001872683F|nr:aldolase/citrate lyase family protein [Pelagibius marinus]